MEYGCGSANATLPGRARDFRSLNPSLVHFAPWRHPNPKPWDKDLHFQLDLQYSIMSTIYRDRVLLFLVCAKGSLGYEGNPWSVSQFLDTEVGIAGMDLTQTSCLCLL